MTTLTAHEGRDVLQATIKVTGAGDGLSRSLEVEPAEYHTGDKVYVVLETEVGPITYEPIKDTDAMRRVHTLRTKTGTVVEHALVGDVLEAQRIAFERAKGITRLPLGNDDDVTE